METSRTNVKITKLLNLQITQLSWLVQPYYENGAPVDNPAYLP
jgi:hypothetical protein